jgi:hypothetical protein
VAAQGSRDEEAVGDHLRIVRGRFRSRCLAGGLDLVIAAEGHPSIKRHILPREYSTAVVQGRRVLLGSTTAAVLPAIGGTLAAASTMLAGEWFAGVFPRAGRQGETNGEKRVSQERQNSAEPASARNPDIVSEAEKHS